MVIVDDVMTAGTAVSEAFELVTGAGGAVCGILVALDRREVFDGRVTAVESMASRLGVPVKSIASREDVLRYLEGENRFTEAAQTLRSYQQRHCAVVSPT